MTSFWKKGTGAEITGTPESSFILDYEIIPNNTMALAKIKTIKIIIKTRTDYALETKYYELMWIIINGEHKGREVIQKIKCFDGKPESIDRALNMFKLIMTLCQYKPSHSNAPTEQELLMLINKTLGIKIREWSIQKADGSGNIEGNFVSEVHAVEGFTEEPGIKMQSKSIESALNRNMSTKALDEYSQLDDDIPF